LIAVSFTPEYPHAGLLVFALQHNTIMRRRTSEALGVLFSNIYYITEKNRKD